MNDQHENGIGENLDADITLDREHAESILHALLIGLDSYGEIERIDDAHRLFASMNRDLPDELKPLHPTGAPDTIGTFTNALRLLTSAMRTS